jgi:pimeloyl-ACP methyl ester carboxylesterase
VVFLAGYRSDMTGTKASFLADVCARRGQAYVRFDYRGHGQSSGRFEDGTIGAWLDDALAILDRIAQGPLLLVGSSMGGWLALLAARARTARIRGLLLVAPAPDFTERLLWQRFDPGQRERLLREGVITEPSPYGDPLPFTRKLIEEGRRHLLLDGSDLVFPFPVHILHGRKDADVPLALSLELAGRLDAPHVTVEILGDGDHRLSRPEDLARLEAALLRLLDEVRDTAPRASTGPGAE